MAGGNAVLIALLQQGNRFRFAAHRRPRVCGRRYSFTAPVIEDT